MKKTGIFSMAWFYFRTGYSFYFVFLVSGLNALMIAYFVVILGTTCEAGKSLEESGDILCIIRWIFPNFGYFVLFTLAVGGPLLVVVGYWHHAKNQLGTHAQVDWKSNPYYFQLIGHNKIIFQILNELLEDMIEKRKIKSILKEDARLKELENMKKDIDSLLKGGTYE